MAKADQAIAQQVPKPPAAWAKSETATQPVSGDSLIVELMAVIKKFVAIDTQAALVVALWILFTWVFEHVAQTNPFLRIISPAPECGKSTLLKLIAKLARSGFAVSSVTVSALLRTIENERRTIVLDEADSFFHQNEHFRNLLDAASDPDTATISFSMRAGGDWKPLTVDIFIPIASGAGPLINLTPQSGPRSRLKVPRL